MRTKGTFSKKKMTNVDRHTMQEKMTKITGLDVVKKSRSLSLGGDLFSLFLLKVKKKKKGGWS